MNQHLETTSDQRAIDRAGRTRKQQRVIAVHPRGPQWRADRRKDARAARKAATR